MKISNQVKIETLSSFLPERSNIKQSIYFFIYRIKIENLSNDSIRLLTRHWDIKDANGNINIVNGEGVVGKTPIINPNEYYTYSSFCPLKTDFGSMKGYYTFSKYNGDIIKTLIPEFSLIVPTHVN